MATSTEIDNIIVNLTTLGLDKDEATVYLTLLQHDGISVVELSKLAKIGRSKVYRLLEKLRQKNLTKSFVNASGLRFQAQPYQQLEGLIKAQETKTAELKQSLPSVFGDIANLMGDDGFGSRVRYYSGIEGLKQVSLNSLEAKGELLIYELKNMSAFMDFGFAEEIRRGLVKHKIHTRELTSLTQMPPWTKVTEQVTKYWEPRYVDPAELDIKLEILIYNQTVALYNYTGGEVFCIEIRSRALADMQKQLFNYVWNQAQPMQKVGNEGAAKVPQPS